MALQKIFVLNIFSVITRQSTLIQHLLVQIIKLGLILVFLEIMLILNSTEIPQSMKHILQQHFNHTCMFQVKLIQILILKMMLFKMLFKTLQIHLVLPIYFHQFSPKVLVNLSSHQQYHNVKCKVVLFYKQKYQ